MTEKQTPTQKLLRDADQDGMVEPDGLPTLRDQGIVGAFVCGAILAVVVMGGAALLGWWPS